MTDELPPPDPPRRGRPPATPEPVGHPLFPTEPGERATPIAYIQLRRYTENGPVDHQRVWPAGEITGQEDIFALFGGGTYEIWGRSALPNGTPGGIVRKLRLTLPGPARPFTPQEQATAAGHPSPAPAAPAAGDRFDLFMHMMAQDRSEQRARAERQEAEMRAAEDRRQQRDEARAQQATQLMVQGLQVVAGIVTTILTRPAPAPTPAPDLVPIIAALLPKPDTRDDMDKLSRVLEIAEKLHPKKGATETLPELLNGFGHAMAGVAEMEKARSEAIARGVPVGMPAPMLPGSEGAPATAPAPPPVATVAPPSPAIANGAPQMARSLPPPDEYDDPAKLDSGRAP